MEEIEKIKRDIYSWAEQQLIEEGIINKKNEISFDEDFIDDSRDINTLSRDICI